ncbi:DUF1269 domain-containing protein [Fuerstiella marisgermanici]|uniref:Putative membrane protein n=1 Tax=Fuerstiella marisgermanici TaxID=1891926 RepID=A0A1P8WC05_9PLAN|nr:DUF1269 domain-containing protein [Fuerstiella marisgermanici]APZ91598.1 putative membrane protein [Fuerstiella marisgermanici]
MATLTVLKFDDSDGATQALEKLEELQKQSLIKVVDAATVSWPQGAKKPKTKQALDMTTIGALDGTFWGLLFGMIFFMPIMGALIGAAAGAIGGAFTDFGIDDRFINDVKGKVTEGTSALFLMSTDAVEDRVTEAFSSMNVEVLATNLSVEAEQKLKSAFQH